MGLVCFECRQEIATGTPRFMLALEKPYMNLWFHKACYDKVKGEIVQYLTENYDSVLKYEEKLAKIRKNS